MMARWRCALLLVLAVATNPGGASPGAAPTVFQTGAGRFEIAASEAAPGQRVIAAAEEAWRLLAGPLGLPEGFSSPVFVRLVPAPPTAGPEPFQVAVEAGGVVSVRIWSSDTEGAIPQAIVRALLVRLAVAQHGASGDLVVPAWLEQACLGWWRTRADAARLDGLRYESARLTPPALEDVLRWQVPPGVSAAGLATGATWLLTLLHGEGGRTGEWADLLRRLLGGQDPEVALAASFPNRYASLQERELWWQTGWHHVRRIRTLPTLDAAESQGAIAALARFVFAPEEHDVVYPLREVMRRVQEPAIVAEVRRRELELGRLVPALHPFYRNAGLSLAEVFQARAVRPARMDVLCAAFEQDWRDAVELHAASTAALDALEVSAAGGAN
jgi:hypothetical protein